MFYVNVLLHDMGFDTKSSLVGNMASTVAYHQALKRKLYFLHLLHYKKSKKEKKLKTL
jgi:hypothetical protein